METLDSVNNIIRVVFINICIYVVFIKAINYKDNNFKKSFIIIVASIIEELLAIILVEKISVLLSMMIIYIIHSIVIAKITKNKIRHSIIITFISLTITYLIYIISILLSGIIMRVIGLQINKDNTVILLIISFIESLIIYALFSIKRFKNGFSFLQNREKVNNIGILGSTFIGLTMLIYSLMSITDDKKFAAYLVTGIIIESICLTIWIRRKITKYYKQKMKEKTIEELENEIKVKDEEINKILEENKAIATINHKYSSRIKALEKFSAEILERPKLIAKMQEEFGAEFGDIQNTIKKLSEEFTKEMNNKIKTSNKLVKTGIFGIDNILEYMKSEAEKNNIKFDLKINGNINYMIEKVINQNKLETLLGDHIKDAIIAINHSDNTYKSILTVIGIIDDCYEICIYDTGIEFEIDTLIKLGTAAITTHKDTGGSGIGFMTTFETLKETKASLIIEEKHPMNNKDYTKAVKIRFDGKNEYRIKSYRAEEIKKQDKEKRIIIKKLKTN